MIVLGYNLRLFSQRADNFDPIWDSPFEGVGPHSFISPSIDGEEELLNEDTEDHKTLLRQRELDQLDPYGITGTWMRVVCFLDYDDLYAFNFAHQIPAGQSREPIDTKEAIRLIRLKLHVTKIEPPGEDDGQDYPVVTFRGVSRSLHSSWDPNANSAIRGTVRQTKEGQIRWTTWSIFHGEERWRSEGIQVGGIRSKRGILGNWFDKYDHS